MQSVDKKHLFVTLTRNSFSSLDDFIDVWSKAYVYSNMELYSDIILKNELKLSDLEKLFQWKNGMPLSDKKANSFEQKILNKVSIINELKIKWNQSLFNQEFEEISTVWKIFLLHIIQPEKYPIFDQHVYRAFKYITEQVNSAELPYYNKTKLNIYYKEYLPFYLDCKEEMNSKFSPKHLDDALWSFGKFLNEYPKLLL